MKSSTFPTSTLAIFGGQPTRTEPYPAWPVIDDRDIQAVIHVLKSGRWGGFPYPGPQTAEFAHRFAEMQGGGYPVPMANGTVTMEIALRALDIGWGDEVIVPAYTFQATAAAVMSAGAIPVIVDIDPQTYCIDPVQVKMAITSKTKAIIPVHLGAEMADMDALLDLAQEFGLVIIEDCAHTHGAKWRDKGAGTMGHFGSFSMQSSKTLTSGEGGVLLCKTPELAAKVASLIDCGRPHDESEMLYTMGSNYRLTELQAALLVVGLQRFPAQAKQRESMADYMDEALSEVPGVRLLKRDPRHTTRSFYRYIFAVDPNVFKVKHDAVCYALENEGIPCETGYEAMHRYSLFQPHLSHLPVPSAFPERFNFSKMSFPHAERACESEAVWLDEAIFRAGERGVDDVILALKKVLSNSTKLAKAGQDLKSSNH